MEAFDLVHTLSRYYGYTPQQVEPAYHLLLQATALGECTDHNILGLTCFYRMHNPEIAQRIHNRDGTVETLFNDISAGQGKPIPKMIEQAVCRVWADQSMG